jgi:hypothetical protein
VQDEGAIYQGVAALTRGLFGGRWGPLILTTHRLLWHDESPQVWPLKWQFREMALADIADVDKGAPLDIIFGGKRLRIRLRNGRTVKFFEGEDKLDWWVERLRDASAPS